jgi:hypothetical protein
MTFPKVYGFLLTANGTIWRQNILKSRFDTATPQSFCMVAVPEQL